MTVVSFRSAEELKEFILNVPVEQFNNFLPKLSLLEISQCILILQAKTTVKSKNRILDLVKFIDHSAQWEKMGKCLSVPTFLGTLDFFSHYPAYQNCLSYILAGLQPKIFFQSFFFFEQGHLALMQHASVFEPLQYQLTQFIHEGESLWHQTNHDIEQLIVDIRLIKHNEINENILDLLEKKISAIKDHLLEYLECINKALSIVWHTNRTDLIDKLSALNETFHHLLQDSLGHSSTLDILSTGLYATLETSLCGIYDNSFLTDQDAAIEGLTRLNIWYLEDYWKIGILPMIEKMEDLNLDPDKFDETMCWEHHQKLFSLVQQQLKRLHIATVSDLKKAHIYSKSLLLKYIERRKNLLLKSFSKISK